MLFGFFQQPRFEACGFCGFGQGTQVSGLPCMIVRSVARKRPEFVTHCFSPSRNKAPPSANRGGALYLVDSLFFLDNLAERIHRLTNAATDVTFGLFGFAFVFEVSVANYLAGLFLD